MFKKNVKADWKTYGFKYRVKDGELHGKIYSAMPLRLKNAAKQAFVLNIGVFVLISIVGSSPLGNIDLFNELVIISWTILLLLSYPWLIMFPHGKRIKVAPRYCKIGRRQYALSDMGTFRTKQNPKKPDQHTIEFSYGLKTLEIPIRNTFEHQLNVIKELNKKIEWVKNQNPATAFVTATPIEARSASF